VQRPKRMGRNPSEQGSALFGAKQSGECGRRKHRGRSEPGQHQRVVRRPQQRPHDVLAQRVEPRGGISEGEPPAASVSAETSGCPFHRAIQHAGAAIVEGVHTVDLRPAPRQAIALQLKPAVEL